MADKVSNISDLIQKVTSSCLLHPLGSSHHFPGEISDSEAGGSDGGSAESEVERENGAVEEERENGGSSEIPEGTTEKVREMEATMCQVFDAVSALKKAYVSHQAAHCPWDPEAVRSADVAVVAELRRLGVLRERFRRRAGGGVGMAAPAAGGVTLREVVAPYEAAVEKLEREVKMKEAEVEMLREKLLSAASVGVAGSGRQGRSHHHHPHQSTRKVSCSTRANNVMAAPLPELFESTMAAVKAASKSLTSLLLSLMKSSHCDIPAAVKSITSATSSATITANAATIFDSIVGPNHAKYALESYVNRKIFQGFDHETFYMDGSLSSLLNPNQFRQDCFTQFTDMKSMDPIELLGILPDCQFGKFCSKKYLAIIHPKMEELLFRDLEHRRHVLAGNHPRSQFYGEFLGLAKAVWMLHLVAFSMDSLPSNFEGSVGAEFQPEFMESVVRFPGGKVVAGGMLVGFPVSPGFKIGNGTVVKARVYLVPKNEM